MIKDDGDVEIFQRNQEGESKKFNVLGKGPQQSLLALEAKRLGLYHYNKG